MDCLLVVVHHASVSEKISTSFAICGKTWIRKGARGKMETFGFVDARFSIVLPYLWLCVALFCLSLHVFECLFSVLCGSNMLGDSINC